MPTGIKIENKKYYPIPNDLVERLTIGLEKNMHTGLVTITNYSRSDMAIEKGFLVELDVDASFRGMIEESNLKEKLGHNYMAKFKSIALEIIDDYLKDKYALITDLINTERVFMHKISFGTSGEGKDKVYHIDITPDDKVSLDKDELAKTKKEVWSHWDDVANLRTSNSLYNLMFLDIKPKAVRKVRLKLKGKKDE